MDTLLLCRWMSGCGAAFMPASLFQAHVLLAALDRCCTGMSSNAPSRAVEKISRPCAAPEAGFFGGP